MTMKARGWRRALGKAGLWTQPGCHKQLTAAVVGCLHKMKSIKRSSKRGSLFFTVVDDHWLADPHTLHMNSANWG